MAQVLFVVLYSPEQVPPLLDAWHEAGVPGATILRSVGAYRAHNWLEKVGLGAINNLFTDDDNVRSKTVFAVFNDDHLLEQAIVAAEKAIGGFGGPNKGLLFVLPVSYVEGLRKPGPKTAPATPPASAMDDAEMITRNTPIAQLKETMVKEPVLVHPNDSLIAVAEAIATNPDNTVACVVNQRGHLVGTLPLRVLMNDLFMDVVPEEFMAASTLDDVMAFAQRNRSQTAGDAMLPAVSVKETDTVKDAFIRMHKAELSGIPVVNDVNEVIGCVDRIQLLLLYAKQQKSTKGE